MSTIIVLISLALATWFWFNSLASRETATEVARDACRQLQVQMLDGTVALKRWGLGRDAAGRLHVRRMYRFDFSTGDMHRYRGTIIMLGSRLQHLDLSEAHIATDGDSDSRSP